VNLNGIPALRRREWIVAALAALGGCGGVDSGGTGTGHQQTLAVGPISGFGSIIVNGVRYDDSFALVDDDEGRALASTDLRLGMRTQVVASAPTLEGGIARATASSIRVRSEIEGPVDAIDGAGTSLVVLGQTVLIVATTVIDDGGVALAPGDTVAVHAGYDVAQGRYVATRIERSPALARYKLHGTVAELELSGRTLRIGPLRIDWSGAAPADPATLLAPGRRLRVALSTVPASGTRVASAIVADALPLDDRENIELEGRVTAFTTLTSFEVDGVPVDARGARFEGGAAGLVLGARVEVEGSLRDGVLRATEVELEDDEGGDESFELNGSIESVDAAAMRFVVRGVTVMWSAVTRFESSSAADLSAGRSVEVRGRLSSDGLRIDATLIHVQS
jgi:hypothetical protein